MRARRGSDHGASVTATIGLDGQPSLHVDELVVAGRPLAQVECHRRHDDAVHRVARRDRLGAMVRKPAGGGRRRHDADAGGPADVLAAKAALREQVWADLDRPGVARFPKPANRIPNFVGAEAAARRLAETPEWSAAATVKSNPDSPQWPVRTRALRGRQGRLHGRAPARRARPLLPARPRASRGRPAPRQLDQGRGVAARARSTSTSSSRSTSW